MRSAPMPPARMPPVPSVPSVPIPYGCTFCPECWRSSGKSMNPVEVIPRPADPEDNVGKLPVTDEERVHTSPNYPDAYPENFFCKWLLVAPVGKLISIHFNVYRPVHPHHLDLDALYLVDIGPSSVASSTLAFLTVVPPKYLPIDLVSVGREVYVSCASRQCTVYDFSYKAIDDFGHVDSAELLVELQHAAVMKTSRYRLNNSTSGHRVTFIPRPSDVHFYVAEYIFYASQNDMVILVDIKAVNVANLNLSSHCIDDHITLYDGKPGPVLMRICHMPLQTRFETTGSSLFVRVALRAEHMASFHFVLKLQSVVGHSPNADICDDQAYRCLTTGLCLSLLKQCDATPDCPLGDDESLERCSLQDKLCGIPAYLPNLNISPHRDVPDIDLDTGRRDSDKERIVGGDEARAHSSPWSVLMYNETGGHQWCGGSIIDKQWILTAAHCFKHPEHVKKYVNVRMGLHDQTKPLLSIPIAEIYKHEQFDPKTLNNDIALVKLAEPLPAYTDKIRRVCLPQKSELSLVKRDLYVTVVGWGGLWPRAVNKTKNTKPQMYARYLQQMITQIMDQDVCNNNYKELTSWSVLPSSFCAGQLKGGKDTCKGDSGGPLVRLYHGRAVQIGIVSWGAGCAQPRLPGVYTRVENYIDWIKETMTPTENLSGPPIMNIVPTESYEIMPTAMPTDPPIMNIVPTDTVNRAPTESYEIMPTAMPTEGILDKLPPLEMPTEGTLDELPTIESELSYEHNGCGDIGIVFIDASEKTQTIKSPDYPSPYPSHSKCQWLIRAPKNKVVEIIIRKDNFDLSGNCSSNYVHLLKLERPGFEHLSRPCGVLGNDLILREATETIFVKFNTTDNFNMSKGFRLEFVVINDLPTPRKFVFPKENLNKCKFVRHHLRKPYTLTDSNAGCDIFHGVPSGMVIKIVFKRLILPGAANSCSDTLKFSWGRIYLDSYSRTFCGPVVHTKTVVILRAKFLTTLFLKQSDERSGDRSNFEIKISRIRKIKVPAPSCPTTSTLGKDDRILSSTGYPLVSHDLSCDWTLDAKKGYLFLVEFVRSEPSSGLDLYDGRSRSFPKVKLVQSVLGVPIIILTTGRYLYAECGYKRDCGLFSFIYTIVADVGVLSNRFVYLNMASKVDSSITNTYYRLSKFTNHVFKAESDKYVKNRKLGWVIVANRNDQKIRITLKNISLKGTKSCANDYLMIMDGIGDRILYKLCHTSSDIVLQTSASSVEIRYVNTHSFRSIGLTMEMKSVESGCGDEVYRCPDSGVCTYLGSLCNGVNDCNEGQDESSHFCAPNNRCGIPTYWPDVAALSETTDKMRIVGGSTARPFSYPWLVSIAWNKKHFCGGTLINRYWVLTAAHCVHLYTKYDLKQITLRFGWHDMGNRNQGLVSDVSTIKYDANFDRVTLNNDIALIKLATPIDAYTDKIRPVCLPEKGATSLVKADAGVIIAGWGALHEKDEHMPPLLNQVAVKVFSNNQCSKAYSKSYVITKNMFCAGKPEGLKDACQGDSGGPLIRLHNGRFSLIGIVSWGFGCARAGQPGVYTKVENYIDWINDIAG